MQVSSRKRVIENPAVDIESECHPPGSISVFGLGLHPVTFAQTLSMLERKVEQGVPGYVITANLNYAMLSHGDPRLDAVNRNAFLVLADGMPLVWASRFGPMRLPERVTGSDLLPALCELASRRDFRVYFFGGGPGVAQEAIKRLVAANPGLRVVGFEAPNLDALSPHDEGELLDRIAASRPDIFVAALSQPKGEYWLAKNCRRIGAPVAIQIGASLDFAAGRVPRAPRWMRRTGLEWAYRLWREPKRLFKRYLANGTFLIRRGWRAS